MAANSTTSARGVRVKVHFENDSRHGSLPRAFWHLQMGRPAGPASKQRLMLASMAAPRQVAPDPRQGSQCCREHMMQEGEDNPRERGRQRRQEGGRQLAEDSEEEEEDKGLGKEETMSCHQKSPTEKWASLKDGVRRRKCWKKASGYCTYIIYRW